MRALIIPVTGSPELRDIPNEVSAFQEIVGGYIEAVMLDNGAHLYFDEEGKIKKYLINVIASVLAFPNGGDVIVGNAVLLSHKGPEDVDVSDSALNMVLSFIEVRQ